LRRYEEASQRIHSSCRDAGKDTSWYQLLRCSYKIERFGTLAKMDYEVNNRRCNKK
jgi:hypothetical protein